MPPINPNAVSSVIEASHAAVPHGKAGRRGHHKAGSIAAAMVRRSGLRPLCLRRLCPPPPSHMARDLAFLRKTRQGFPISLLDRNCLHAATPPERMAAMGSSAQPVAPNSRNRRPHPVPQYPPSAECHVNGQIPHVKGASSCLEPWSGIDWKGRDGRTPTLKLSWKALNFATGVTTATTVTLRRMAATPPLPSPQFPRSADDVRRARMPIASKPIWAEYFAVNVREGCDDLSARFSKSIRRLMAQH
jgi:hypothetical protein